MRDLTLSLLLVMLPIIGMCQVKSNVQFLSQDGRPALERIAMSFYEHPLAPETTCTEAFCSVTFIIMRSSQLDSIQFSPGVPAEILRPMTEAIKANAAYWALDQDAPLRVIIPLYIVPSSMCPEKDRVQIYFPTSSQMFDYGKPLSTGVNRVSYLRNAKATVEGLILPTMLVHGKLTDVFHIDAKK